MRWVLFFLLIFSISSAHAQHCPWDCSGLVILDWPSDKKFSEYQVRLVDSGHKVVFNHNVHESPESEFKQYEELKIELTAKLPKYSWYEYYTVFDFAAGSPVTLYNFCDYMQELYVEVQSKKDPTQKNYFSLNRDQKFHIHERSNWEDKTPETFDPKFKVKIRF